MQTIAWKSGAHSYSGTTLLKFVAATTALLALFVLLFPCHLGAQVSTADVLGTITDPSGAVIASAKVTIRNVETGIERSATSNSKGEYLFTLLQVGTYQVSVEAPGFEKFVASSITLSAGDRARVNSTMKMGTATETVAVNASTAPALDTDSSAVGSLITDQTLSDMPLNGRNITDMVRLSAGITVGASSGVGYASRTEDSRANTSYSANGQASNANTNMIDGVDNNERLYGVIGIRPSLDGVQEVKVLTNLYTAEVGRTAGGAVDVITKSGTNKFHGSAYNFLRNNMFDSATLSGVSKPELLQNQFGGSLGGRIQKGKTFFFGDYEGFRQVSGESVTELVPTALMRTGDFSELASADSCTGSAGGGGPGGPGGPAVVRSGGVRPEATSSAACLLAQNPNLSSSGLNYTFDNVGANLISLYPAPNVNQTWSAARAATYNYEATPRASQNSGSYDARIDHNFRQADTLTGHYTINDITTTTPPNFPGVKFGSQTITGGGGEAAYQRVQMLSLAHLHIFQPNLMLQLKASYLRYSNNAMTVNAENAATTLGFPCDAVSCINSVLGGANYGLPLINNDSSLGFAALGDSTNLPLHNADNTFNYSASLTWNHGSHSVKTGVNLIRRQVLYQQAGGGTMGYFNIDGLVTGNFISDLLVGAAAAEERGTELVVQHLRTWEPSAYIQDDWRTNRWLTLNLGVRYEIFTPFTEIDGYMSNFDTKSGLLVSPDMLGDQHSNSTMGVRTNFTNIAPRLGFSSSLSHEMVLRGGFGVTYFIAPASVSTGANAPFLTNVGCGQAGGTESVECTGEFGWVNTNNIPSQYVTPGLGAIKGGISVPLYSLVTATDPANYMRLNALDMNESTPYLEQWSLQLEKQMGGNVFTLGYVGNAGRHIMIGENINQVTTYGSENPYPASGSGSIVERTTAGTSSYNAMQLMYTRRLTSGLTSNVNYTWSHDLDIGDPGGVGLPIQVSCPRYGCQVDNPVTGTPSITGIKYDYGNSNNDLRHRVAVMTSYHEPFGNSLRGVAGAIAKGWTVDGSGSWQTGLPFSVMTHASSLGLMMQRDDIISNPYKAGDVTMPDGTTCTGPNKLGSGTFNKCAFWDDASTSIDPGGPDYLGNSHRNSLFAPHSWVMNSAISKEFPVYESYRLMFRAEAFNLTNTTNDASPDSTLGDALLGTIARTASTGRQVQFALRLSF
jgi:hypothetical protein